MQFFSDTHILLQLLVFSSLDCELFTGRAHVVPSIVNAVLTTLEELSKQYTQGKDPAHLQWGLGSFVCLFASFEFFEV